MMEAAGQLEELELPLSELLHCVPVDEVEAYVYRAIDLRRREIKGRIPRPLNAFMLYRKAFQGYVLERCNFRYNDISRLCGKSWNIEAETVRAQFRWWAAIERAAHRAAHPDYKLHFSRPRDRRMAPSRVHR